MNWFFVEIYNFSSIPLELILSRKREINFIIMKISILNNNKIQTEKWKVLLGKKSNCYVVYKSFHDFKF